MDYEKLKKAELIKELKKQEKQIISLKGVKTKAKNVKEAVKSELDEIKKQLEEQKKKHSSVLDKTKKELQQERSAHEKDVQSEKDKHKKLRDELKEKLSSELDKTKKELDKESSDHKNDVQSEKDKHKKQVDELKEKHSSELARITEELEKERSAHEKDVQSEKDKHKKHRDELKEKLSSELDKTKQELDKESSARRRDVESEKEKHKKNVDELREKHSSELKQLEDNHEKETAGLKDSLEKERKKFEKQIEEIKTKQSGELDELRKQLEQAQSDRDEAQKNLEHQKKQTEDLASDNETALENEKLALSDRLDTANQTSERLHGEVDSLKKLLVERDAELQSAIMQLEAVAEKDAGQSDENIKLLEAKLSKYKKTMETLGTDHDKLLELVTERDEEIQLLKNQLQSTPPAQAGGDLASLQEQLRNAQLEIQKTEERLEREIQSRVEAEGELARHAADKLASVSDPSGELQKYIEQNAELKSDLASMQNHIRTAMFDLKKTEDRFEREIDTRIKAENDLAELRENVERMAMGGGMPPAPAPPVTLPEITFTFDSKFAVIEVSPSVEEALGYAPGDLVGKRVYELSLLPQDSIQQLFNSAKQILAGETIVLEEFELIANDGNRNLGRFSSANVSGDGDSRIVTCDITELKRCIQEAGQKMEMEPQKVFVQEMKKHDDVKNELVAVIKKELSTPLILLNSAVKVFLDGVLGEMTDEQKKLLNMMRQNMDKLLQFTTDIASLARSESQGKN